MVKFVFTATKLTYNHSKLRGWVCATSAGSKMARYPSELALYSCRGGGGGGGVSGIHWCMNLSHRLAERITGRVSFIPTGGKEILKMP